MSEYLVPLLVAWGIQWMGVLSPGPGVALILGVATSRGRAAALTTCIGIAAGSVVLSVATVVGLAAVFAEIAEVMFVIKLLGAAYLAWLSYGALKKAISPPPPPDVSPDAVRVAARRSFLAGFTMQVVNTKALFFWMAIAATGVLAGAPASILALFVSVAALNSFVGHGAWAVMLSSRPFLALYARGRRWVEAALGCFFAFAAFKIATSRT